MSEQLPHPASFRDPAGFVFRVNEVYFRQVNKQYAPDYETLISSGLYRTLTEKGLLITHKEIAEDLTDSPDRYKTLLPEQLDMISYPYEWGIGQLRDAALLTLEVMAIAIGHGMILKDASPFNIQFHRGKPLFIDSLSFEKDDFSRPWIAYRQFCECFLFPLYLEHYHGAGLQKLLSIYPDGIPVAIAAKLLPARSRLSLGVWMHVHLLNLVKSSAGPSGRKIAFDKQKLLRLVRHLENNISGLRSAPIPASRDGRIITNRLYPVLATWKKKKRSSVVSCKRSILVRRWILAPTKAIFPVSWLKKKRIYSPSTPITNVSTRCIIPLKKRRSPISFLFASI